MASSGYGVEATVEGIWNTLWVTAQFDFINALIGTQFNFWITDDGGTDVTDTKVKEILKAETHVLFAFWNAIIKIEGVNNPWNFISVWINDHLSGDDFYRRYKLLIEKCARILSQTESVELVTIAGFGTSSTL